MTNPQVLSDGQITEIALQEQFLLFCDGLEEFTLIARAIESATLEAVRGQEPELWISQRDLDRLKVTTVYRPLVSTFKPLNDGEVPLYLHPSPTQPPAQAERAPVDERAAFESTMREKHGWEDSDFQRDSWGYRDNHTGTAWMAWHARAALQSTPPAALKGQP